MKPEIPREYLDSGYCTSTLSTSRHGYCHSISQWCAGWHENALSRCAWLRPLVGDSDRHSIEGHSVLQLEMHVPSCTVLCSFAAADMPARSAASQVSETRKVPGSDKWFGWSAMRRRRPSGYCAMKAEWCNYSRTSTEVLLEPFQAAT